jgi:hypothetical protein
VEWHCLLRIETTVGLCGHGNELYGSINVEIFYCLTDDYLLHAVKAAILPPFL